MKKGVLVVASLAVFSLVISLFFLYYDDSSKVVFENSRNNSVLESNTLTMMYETGVDSGEYQVTSDNVWPQDGFIFNETLSSCENNSEIYWDDATSRVMVEAINNDKCYVYFDMEPKTLTYYITNKVYTGMDGENGLYYHDGQGTYTNASQEAGDNSYRYAGADPDNYICFGSDAETCPADNLYRIIGVFDGQVKLIKSDYMTSLELGISSAFNADPNVDFFGFYKGSQSIIETFFWNKTNNNSWSTSSLNTQLNNYFLSNINSDWSNFIVNFDWQIGGGLYNNISHSTIKTVYQYELLENNVETTYNSKIGLMYVSDYGYAATPDNWLTTLYYYDNSSNQENNWLFLGGWDWTITKLTDNDSTVFFVGATGFIDRYYAYYSNDGYRGVRACFYLDSSVNLAGGTGTKTDPYIIDIGSV